MAADGSLTIDSKINEKGFRDGVSSLKKALKGFVKKTEEMGKEIDQAFAKSDKVIKLEKQISQTEDKIEGLVKEMKQVEETQVPTAEYAELEKQIEKTGQKFENLLDRQEKYEALGKKKTSSAWKSLQYDMELVSAQYAQLIQKKKEMESCGTAFKSGTETDSYQKKAAELDALNAKIYELKQSFNDLTMSEIGAEPEEQEYVTLAEAIKRHLKAAGESIKEFRKNAVIGFATAPVRGFVAAEESLYRGAKAVAKEMLNFGFNSAKNGAIAAKNAFVKTTKTLLGLEKGAKKSHKSLSMLSRVLVLSALRRAISSISSAFKEGIQNLVQYSDEANQSMSELMNNGTYLKNSFAAAFAPILSYVVPVLSTLTNYLATATAYVNQFFAALGGGTTYTKAVKMTNDYAESLKSTGSAAKEATKMLAPFDDLVQISQNNSSSSGGSSTDPSQMFTEEAISGNIAGFTERLKELFEEEDWTGIGQMIGEKVNEGVTKFGEFVSWNRVGAEVAAFIMAFTAILNSAVGTIDWHAVGMAAGSGMDTILNTLYLLLTEMDWVLLGAALALALNGLADQVDWDLFGRTIGAYFQARLSALYGFASTADWTGIGQAIGSSLNGMADEIDWAMLGLTLALGLSGAFDALGNFALIYDWISLGLSLASGLSTFFQNFDWIGAGTAVSDFVLGLLAAFVTFIKATDWEALGTGVAEMALAIDWWGLLTSVIDAILQTLKAIVLASWPVLSMIAKELWDGFCAGVKEFFSNPGTFIKENITDPFFFYVRDLLGIHSPSTIMAEMGQDLWNGFCNGITEFFSNPSAFIKEHITDPFINGVKDLLGIHSPSVVMGELGSNTVAGFNQGITNEQSATQNVVQSWASGVAKWFSDKFGISSNDAAESKKWATSIMSGFNTTVKSQYKNSQGIMETWAENIRKWFVGETADKGVNEMSWERFAENIIQAFINAINIGHTGAKEPAENWASHVREWFWGDADQNGTGGMYAAFYQMAKRINEGFANGISDFAYMAKSAIREWAEDIMDAAEEEFDIHSPSREFREIAEYVVKGFNEGLSDMISTSKNVAERWLDSVMDIFDAADISVPVGLDIPNASSYIPRIATGTVVPPRAGEASLSMRSSGESQTEVLSYLIQKIDELLAQLKENGNQPIELTLKLTGNLAALARTLKPELDKEAARKGVSLVIVGGA